MDFEKLNRAASTYFTAQTPESFEDLYAEIVAVFRKMNRVRICESGYGDDNDADSILNSVVMRAIRREKAATNFGSFLLTSLRNAQLDFFKAEKRRRRRFQLTLDSDAPTLELEDDETVESQFYSRKKEADQRQLISFLLSSGKPDATTNAIVEAFKNAPPSATDTAIAKSIGIHHETVKRKLRKLSRHYDANRFGELSDIIAV